MSLLLRVPWQLWLAVGLMAAAVAAAVILVYTGRKWSDNDPYDPSGDPVPGLNSPCPCLRRTGWNEPFNRDVYRLITYTPIQSGVCDQYLARRECPICHGTGEAPEGLTYGQIEAIFKEEDEKDRRPEGQAARERSGGEGAETVNPWLGRIDKGPPDPD